MANEFARRLRKTMTPQEVTLWANLRRLRRSDGWHFRRQAPFRGYVLDFVCHEAKLVIEADGSQHAGGRDLARDGLLAREGYDVLRFWNVEIDREFDGVWTAIGEALRNAEARLIDRDDVALGLLPPSP